MASTEAARQKGMHVPPPLPKKVEDDLGGKSKLGAAFKLLREDALLIVFATIFSFGSTGLSLLTPQYSSEIFDILASRNVSMFPSFGEGTKITSAEAEQINAHILTQSFFQNEYSVGTALLSVTSISNDQM